MAQGLFCWFPPLLRPNGAFRAVPNGDLHSSLLYPPRLLCSLSTAQELELMCKMGVKAEIQSLSSFDFQYLTKVYLPRKLKEGDWI